MNRQNSSSPLRQYINKPQIKQHNINIKPEETKVGLFDV